MEMTIQHGRVHMEKRLCPSVVRVFVLAAKEDKV